MCGFFLTKIWPYCLEFFYGGFRKTSLHSHNPSPTVVSFRLSFYFVCDEDTKPSNRERFPVSSRRPWGLLILLITLQWESLYVLKKSVPPVIHLVLITVLLRPLMEQTPSVCSTNRACVWKVFFPVQSVSRIATCHSPMQRVWFGKYFYHTRTAKTPIFFRCSNNWCLLSSDPFVRVS